MLAEAINEQVTLVISEYIDISGGTVKIQHNKIKSTFEKQKRVRRRGKVIKRRSRKRRGGGRGNEAAAAVTAAHRTRLVIMNPPDCRHGHSTQFPIRRLFYALAFLKN